MSNFAIVLLAWLCIGQTMTIFGMFCAVESSPAQGYKLVKTYGAFKCLAAALIAATLWPVFLLGMVSQNVRERIGRGL